MDEVNKFESYIRELGGEKKPVTKKSIVLPTKSTTGKIEPIVLNAGESAGEVQRVQPAGEIVRDIVEEAASITASEVYPPYLKPV